MNYQNVVGRQMNKYYTCNKCNQEKADYLGNCFDCDIVLKEMNEYIALVIIPAENEEDFKEQLDALDSYELEWWKKS